MSDKQNLIYSVMYGNVDYYPPIINSAYILSEAGFRQLVICRDDRPETNVHYPSNVVIKRINSDSVFTWLSFIIFIVRVFANARQRPMLCIGHDMPGFMVARLLAWLHRQPVIYHCHDFVEDKARLGMAGKVVKAFEERFARTAKLVIVPEKVRAKIVTEALNLDVPAVVVANAPLKAHEKSNKLQVILSEKGYDFEKIVLRIGSIGSTHGLETTIRSMSLWQSESWGFVVIGFGDADYIQLLNDLAIEIGVTKRVVILPPVSYNEIAELTIGANLGHGLYESTDLNSMYNTTASNKFTEYMAAKLPILLADNPSNSEFVKTYQQGVVANVSSPESVAEAVNRVLGNESVAESMGQAGYKLFREELNYSKQYAKVLDSVLNLVDNQ